MPVSSVGCYKAKGAVAMTFMYRVNTACGTVHIYASSARDAKVKAATALGVEFFGPLGCRYMAAKKGRERK